MTRQWHEQNFNEQNKQHHLNCKRPHPKNNSLVFFFVFLFFFVFYCFVLYCISLHCVVLYCFVLCCIVLYCFVLHFIALCCIVLFCIVCAVLFARYQTANDHGLLLLLLQRDGMAKPNNKQNKHKQPSNKQTTQYNTIQYNNKQHKQTMHRNRFEFKSIQWICTPCTRKSYQSWVIRNVMSFSNKNEKY